MYPLKVRKYYRRDLNPRYSDNKSDALTKLGHGSASYTVRFELTSACVHHSCFLFKLRIYLCMRNIRINYAGPSSMRSFLARRLRTTLLDFSP